MKLADIKITIPTPNTDDYLVYDGFIHPQIQEASLINMIIQNFALIHNETFSVIVSGDSPAGPYTCDVQPVGENIVPDTNPSNDPREEKRIF